MIPGPDGPQTSFLVGFELFGVLEIKDRNNSMQGKLAVQAVISLQHEE